VEGLEQAAFWVGGDGVEDKGFVLGISMALLVWSLLPGAGLVGIFRDGIT
jgi:hypothetical protein